MFQNSKLNSLIIKPFTVGTDDHSKINIANANVEYTYNGSSENGC